MSKSSETPMMRQYNQVKSKYPNTVLLFRMGDFFETFGDDAAITARVCGIALTKRNNGAAGDMALAGFPHHQLDAYLPKLVRAGHRVAVCEQLEDPKLARGIVKRDVIEVVTPGVALYDKLLESKKNNYLAAIDIAYQRGGLTLAALSFCDVSTGEFFLTELPFDRLADTLESISPAEILINKSNKEVMLTLTEKLSFKPAITKLEDWLFDFEFGKEQLLKHFKTQSLKGFGVENYTIGISVSGVIINYISETQKTYLPQIKKLSEYNPFDYMTLDFSTRRNLEITFSMWEGGKQGTLYDILDKSLTPMGGRLFKKWISRPLRNIDKINERLKAVKVLVERYQERANLRKILHQISDLERLISKVCTGRANPKDVLNIMYSLKLLPEINNLIKEFNNDSLNKIISKFKYLTEIVELIGNAINPEASVNLGTGNTFKSGFNAELDEYLEAKYSGKSLLNKYQAEEKEKSGIATLKVSYNNVFGYYIEISKMQAKNAPEYYERRQTLANAERYTTPELKQLETKILGAEEKISTLEIDLFNQLREKIAYVTEEVQANAQLISIIDCLQSYAEASQEYNYCEPIVDESDDLIITNGRHPVVEKLLPHGETFATNNTNLTCDDEQIHIITGPNMAGKSCYLRQVGLIVLLAQIGCFVPASYAKVGLVDRIFTRVGAQDNIIAGESTFLVEMQEAANIINNATKKSLILLDEVGRGTATFDGISIAWSISEHIHDAIGAKTLFATHYHELNDLASRFERIKNYKVEVIESDSKIIFTHKLLAGSSDHSFGIHVARMAGLPMDIINRANEVMSSLEKDSNQEKIIDESQTRKPHTSSISKKENSKDFGQLAIFEIQDDKIRDKLRTLQINSMTPIQALQLLSELHIEAKK